MKKKCEEERRLLNGALDTYDYARWSVICDYYDERGDEANLALWTRRLEWFPELEATYRNIATAAPPATCTLPLLPYKLVFDRTPQRVAFVVGWAKYDPNAVPIRWLGRYRYLALSLEPKVLVRRLVSITDKLGGKDE